MFYIPIKFKSYLEKVEKKQHNEIYFKIYCNEAFLNLDDSFSVIGDYSSKL